LMFGKRAGNTPLVDDRSNIKLTFMALCTAQIASTKVQSQTSFATKERQSSNA